MIISASRRTDIPAFYAEWFINRMRAGFCTVPNPFNRHQVAYVSLRPEDVDVIVFWTRNARPLLPYLAELDRLGYRYYFQYTVMDNPRALDPKAPTLAAAVRTFSELAERVGAQRVIWRYDPIVISSVSSLQFHVRVYEGIARALRGRTQRSVISLVDRYRKAEGRLRRLAGQGIAVRECDEAMLAELIPALARIAGDNGMEIVSCAEEIDLRPYGVRPGKCVDDEYIARTFGIQVTNKKDAAQREECGCVVSKDIGMYDTCLFGCQYCYATSSFERARVNHEQEHDLRSPSLLGWHEAAAAEQGRFDFMAQEGSVVKFWGREDCSDLVILTVGKYQVCGREQSERERNHRAIIRTQAGQSVRITAPGSAALPKAASAGVRR